MGEQAEVLEDHREPPPAELAEALGAGLPDVLPVELDLAEGGLDQAGQAADEGGLAGPGQAHDHEDLAGLHVERHVVDRDGPAVPRHRGFDRVGRGDRTGLAAQAALGRPEDLPQVADRDRGLAGSAGARAIGRGSPGSPGLVRPGDGGHDMLLLGDAGRAGTVHHRLAPGWLDPPPDRGSS